MPESPNPKLRAAPEPPEERFAPDGLRYAELDVTTNFSFLCGASHADELVLRAARLGYHAIAVTDVNTLAGVVRMHDAARQIAATGWGPKLIIGARLVLRDAPDLLVWAPDRAAYARLCRLLTAGRRRAEKGACELYLDDFLEHQQGLLAAVAFPPRQRAGDQGQTDPQRLVHELRAILHDRLSIAASFIYGEDDAARIAQLAELSRRTRVPLLATNHAHYHIPQRRPLQDVLTCIRHGCTIHDAGLRLFPNAERYLKTPGQMHRLFAGYPQAIERGIEIADRCAFSLEELRYEYPREIVPAGRTPLQYLSELAWNGARDRYPAGIPARIGALIEHELKLIAQLRIEAYFLTVYDLVRFARSRGILCQGRGSAANSAVCYCIGVTSVDPAQIDVLFERFVSAARNEPPDIDIDFEHERREEVIQYIYAKYGRDRAGMTATVITYRGRSAVRDVGKVLGFSLDVVDQLAGKLDWWHRGTVDDGQLAECGIDPADRAVRQIVALTGQLLGFPRHLSQHTGGLVMTRGLLCEMVPIENASMEDRTVIEWDKDDIDTLGLLKVDVLALGMLTCISKALRLVEWGEQRRGDGETNRRSGGPGDGESKDISGTGGLAEIDGAGKADLSGDRANAGERTVRSDSSDETCCRLCPVEHCRGLWASESPGSVEVPSNCAGIIERVGDPVRVGTQPENVEAIGGDSDSDCRSRSYASRADPQPGTATRLADTSSLRLSVSSSPRRLELHTVPREDPAVYDMICDADTIGVFQIESRAQMSMLPRLRPRCFYDLVIEVAIVRPGPIQGNMVHPYLRRRNGLEPVTFPSEDLRRVLGKTLGVPLFQEQAMRVAMVGAGFSGDDADRLRRAMAAWRKSGEIEKFHAKIVEGMTANGYTRDFAEQCFNQIRGFAEYGFPESHSASFALLVYVSAWLKRHHPAAFACALLNSQPMGFYAPAQIVRDAREHGVEVRPIDVNFSDWDCSLESDEATKRQSDGGKETWGVGGPALRLGMRQIKGMRQDMAERIMAARQHVGTFTSIEQFQKITAVPIHLIRRLAEADAFGSLGLSRRASVWEALPLKEEDHPLFELSDGPAEQAPPQAEIENLPLPPMPLGQEVMTDYATHGLSLKQHPVALVRQQLAARKIIPARLVNDLPAGRWVKVCGLVLIRQRPGTASGIVFETLEDETGIVNLIVRPEVYERYRPAARHAGLLQADGYIERQGQVVHIMVKRMFDLSGMLSGFQVQSRDFH
jgi:error-prone DNA polymerase